MSDVRLTSLSHGGGCGCKIAPAALTEILAKVPRPFLDPALLVGIETSDDAAVYRLNDEQAVVATTDFFMPIVDDPMYGLVALGVIHPQRVKRNSTARAGDAIVLGKALGVGILSAALKKGALPEEGYRQMLASTTQLNTVGHRLPEMVGIHAMTD